jgi:HIRAN domain
MGLLRRLFGIADSPAPAAISLPGGDNIVQVVGESHYQANLTWACGGTNPSGPNRARVVAELRAEPTNRYDPNAVVVLVGNRVVGYLARDEAAEYQPVLLGWAGPATCEARIKGGFAMDGRKRFASLGIELFLAEPQALSAIPPGA